MGAWIALLPGIVGIFLLWVCGGAYVLLAAGIRDIRTFLTAPLVACAVIGLLALASSLFTWSLFYVLAGLVAFCAVVFGVRAAVARGDLERSLRNQRRHLAASAQNVRVSKLLGMAAGLALNAAFVFVMVATSVGSPEYFMQNYDSTFHLSVVRHIAETGNASPVGAGSVMGAENAIYPALWHAHVALVLGPITGGAIAAGSWTVVLALLMFALPLSACALVYRLFPRCSGCTLALAAVVPSLLSNSAMGFLTFGPLLANIGGIVFLPMALAMVMSSFSIKCDARGVAVRIASLATCLFGLGLFHPNAVLTLTVFLLPFFVSIAHRKLSRAGLLVLFAGCWAALFNSSLFARTVQCLDRVPADVEKAEYFFGRLGIDYGAISSLNFLVLGVSVVIVAACVVAAVKLHTRWRHSWYLVGLGIIGAQLFASLFPTDWFSIIATAFWYRDCYRLNMALRFLACLAVLAIPEMLARFARARLEHNLHLRIAATALVAIVTSLALVFVAVHGWRDYRAGLYGSSTGIRTQDTPDALTDARSEFCQRITDEADGAVVLNGNNDASVWLYPLYGANALIKGRAANQMSSMDDNLSLVIAQIDRYGMPGPEGDEVRRAVEALELRYVVQMSDVESLVVTFDSDGAIQYEVSNAVNRIDASTPGFALVFEQDGMRLYRLEPSSVAGV